MQPNVRRRSEREKRAAIDEHGLDKGLGLCRALTRVDGFLQVLALLLGVMSMFLDLSV